MLLVLQQHRLDAKWAMSSSSVTSKLVKIQHQGQRHYGLRQQLLVLCLGQVLFTICGLSGQLVQGVEGRHPLLMRTREAP